MIAARLTNPRHFFGSRPFPWQPTVTATTTTTRAGADKLSGPVVAWLMIEVLRTKHFPRDHAEAVRRLVEMMTRQDNVNACYDSATGRPLGAEGDSGSCAVFMELAGEG